MVAQVVIHSPTSVAAVAVAADLTFTRFQLFIDRAVVVPADTLVQTASFLQSTTAEMVAQVSMQGVLAFTVAVAAALVL
jgi:hypothetical protein